MKFYCHPQAIVESKQIGDRTRIWAFVHILSGAKIGVDCNICDHTFIENDVIVGDRVTIKCGVQLWDGVLVEDDVFIGPNVTFTNDPFPRSKAYLAKHPVTVLEKGCSIGANATILPGIRIGRYAMVGAASVVTKDVPPYALVVGCPARVRRKINRITEFSHAVEEEMQHIRRVVHEMKEESSHAQDPAPVLLKCKFIDLPKIADARGNLTFVESATHIPFEIKRVFYLYDVPGGAERAGHALRTCHQFLIAMSGSFDVVLDDGHARKSFHLNRSYYGLYIPPLIWREILNFSSGSVCLVLASEFYCEKDYYRNYEEFRAATY